MQRKTNAMARPALNGETVQVAFRLPTSLIAEIDALAKRLRKGGLGVTVSRTEAARVALVHGLRALEKKR